MSRAFLALLLSMATIACDGTRATTDAVCDAVLSPSVVAHIRDNSGKAAAVGATLRLIGAVDLVNRGGPLVGWTDSLTMYAGGNSVAGPMDIQITKPWHTTTSLRGVKLVTGPCGVITPVQIGFLLKRQANAPPVRQVVLEPQQRSFNRSGLTSRVPFVVLADDSLSPEVTWATRDASVISVTSDGLMTSKCRKSSGSTWIVASAVASPSVRDSLIVTVASDTDPGRCPGS